MVADNPNETKKVDQKGAAPPAKRWDVDAFAAALIDEASAGQVFALQGGSTAQMLREGPALRAALNRAEMPLFVLDPTGATPESTRFLDMLISYVRLAELRGRLSEPARHLFEFLTTADDQTISGLFPAVGGRQYNDTLCRLWTLLSRDMPAALLVVNARHFSPGELKTLNHLARFFFADPIEQLTPELQARDRGLGRLVFLEYAPDFPLDLQGVPLVKVDLTQSTEASVRAFLADPQIVRRFMESTGGDPKRLGELVDSLPVDIQNFWLYRYEKLSALEQSLVNILAVAGQPILVEVLHDSAALLQVSEYFARSLRRLNELGFASRTITAGVVKIHIANPDFARAVVESLPDTRRRTLHQALADAVVHRDDGEFRGVFLAQHYLAAGDGASGFLHGKRAAKYLIGRRNFEQAETLLDGLLDYAESEEDRRALHAQLIEVHAGLGHPKRALTHCARLDELIDDAISRLRLRCQTGRLLNHVGEHERAVALFEKVIAATVEAPDQRALWVEAQLGKAEALFLLGRHETAQARAIEVMERVGELDAGENLSAADQSALDMGLIQARNLAGKVAILRGECQRARELFENNRALAAQWGWDDEAARSEANLGLVALQEKDFTDAIERLERAQQMARSPAALRRAYTFINLGIIHQRKGRYEQALHHYLEGLRASRQEGDDAGYAMAAYNLVTLYQDLGAFRRARAMIEHLQSRQAQDAASQFLGDLPTVVLGSLLLDAKDYPAALAALAELGDSSHESSVASLPAREARLRTVEAHLALGQREVAERIVADSAPAEAESASQPQLQPLFELGRGALALDKGDADAALKACRGMAEIARATGYSRDALRISHIVARALVALKRPQEARALLERELQQLQHKARGVPEVHRADFFAVPIHQDLVELLRKLQGDVPDEFEAPAAAEAANPAPADRLQSGAGAPKQTVDLNDPAFRRWRSRYKEIIGEAPRLHQLFRMVDRVSASDSSVLLLGESGTGKELMAEAVHTHSSRAKGPFVKVNCAAFVEELLLSELFGHVKGAFTGAVAEKVGRFELADGGTLFLDEIGDISPKTQVALLRVLQEGCFEKVGAAETRKVDVRVVCATNKNLEEMVQRGEFRLDLYYRLKGVVMELPPLRERRADIARLAMHFARTFAGSQRPKQFSADVLKFLTSYSWPGNIRELQNFVRSILLFVEGETVQMSHVNDFSDFFAGGEVDLQLPEIDYAIELEDYEEVAQVYQDPEQALVEQIIAEGMSLAKIKSRLELESIRRALIETGGNITRAADMLQMKRPRLSQIVNSTDDLLALKNELVG